MCVCLYRGFPSSTTPLSPTLLRVFGGFSQGTVLQVLTVREMLLPTKLARGTATGKGG